MKFYQSQTFENLIHSIEEEMKARNKYKIYAEQAKKEELMLISKIFTEVAHNEAEHSELYYEHLEEVERYNITPQPKMVYNKYKTLDNLKDAISDEHTASKLYIEYSKKAEEEGYDEVAYTYKEISKIEESHKKVFQELHDKLENNTLYNKDDVYYWRCMNCGHIHYSKSAPSPCPVCGHSQGWFKISADKY